MFTFEIDKKNQFGVFSGWLEIFKDDVANKSVSAQIERKARRAPHTQNIMGKKSK